VRAFGYPKEKKGKEQVARTKLTVKSRNKRTGSRVFEREV
jgi:hypothetical protein